MKKHKKYSYTIPVMGVQVAQWQSNWKRYGSGRDPELHEKGWRKIGRLPNPERPLNFSKK